MKFKELHPHLADLEKYNENLSFWNEKLTSLEGCPKEINGDFSCSTNQLTSLIGGPKNVHGFYNCRNNQLTSLDGVASYINGWLSFRNNPIESITGIHKQIKFYGGTSFYVSESTTKGVLDLFRLNAPNLKTLNGNIKIKSIFNKYFQSIRDGEMSNMEAMIHCQSELIENDLEKYTEY